MPSFFMSSAAKAGAPARASDMRAAIEAEMMRVRDIADPPEDV
jgi:hypothetical protein